ncbi:hypothetical protein [Geomobilimonas luticola]|uniref:Uncharacterized protein n=1 Tax=Geomobilimonas luticola TaxID=1114878 RepID=A0ABS5S8F9_9BACT|nr:hypothetical protein [Geomobilimonas luticola]MBT0651663.1 hypothetical protein [Geomobilimonas luticola]
MTPPETAYLTELILALQNEVQSAVDYLHDVSAREGTELGKSSALMGIERLRIKVPFKVELKQERRKVEGRPDYQLPPEIMQHLVKRKGFLIDKGEPGKMGLYSKIKVTLNDQVTTAGSTDGGEETPRFGEIEITFAPLRRED